MSNKRSKRIINEIKELESSCEILKQNGVYFHYEETNINIIYAMLIGPKGTPYENGFYFFKFEYPESYPMQPPSAKYCTQGNLVNPHTNKAYHVRFNPNLYVDGKVCLSMLNTWAGPGWVPTNTISNVLMAIQALVLNENPLENEPGFEKADKAVLNSYNQVIHFANIKIAVLEMIEKTPKDYLIFKNHIIEHFKNNIEWYNNHVLKKNDELQHSVIKSAAYGMELKFEYDTLLFEISHLQETLLSMELSTVMNINSST